MNEQIHAKCSWSPCFTSFFSITYSMGTELVIGSFWVLVRKTALRKSSDCAGFPNRWVEHPSFLQGPLHSGAAPPGFLHHHLRVATQPHLGGRVIAVLKIQSLTLGKQRHEYIVSSIIIFSLAIKKLFYCIGYIYL